MLWKTWWLAALVPLGGQACADEVNDVLDREGLVVVDTPLRQGFSAYINPEHPVFVTSDSLLMAYHRLFEESVAQDEVAGFAGHLDFWPGHWKKIPAKPLSADPTDVEGLRRCRLSFATALRLLTGRLPEGLREEESAAVATEVSRVEKCEGTAPPPWLQSKGGEVPYVSYAAFRPASFHEGVGALERYYRFRKWLQEMPLDLEDPATRSMAEHLAHSMAGMDVDRLFNEIQPLFSSASLFVPLLQDASQEVEPRRLEEWRDDLRERFADRQDWRFLASMIPAGSEIARALLPEGQVGRTPEVLGAAMGNPLAMGLMGPDLDDAQAIGRKALVNTWGIPSVWMALNATPDARAPELMRSEAWQRKQLNATLGSWAEYRHALQLASREDGIWRGSAELLPGFIEPVPEFYHALGSVTVAMLEQAREGPALRDGLSSVLLLERLLGHLKRAKATRDDKGDPIDGNDDDLKARRQSELLNRLFPKAPSEGPQRKWPYPEKYWDLAEPRERAVVTSRLEAFLGQYWSGDERAVQLIQKEASGKKDDLTPRLGVLAATCFRLEAMAERQLSNQPWRQGDIEFLKGYGMHLGWLMFYEGNSYLAPDDDAPRIARYATDASPAETRVHHAAVARPRLLLIHYPDQDGEPVLCQGAVYAFRNVAADHNHGREEWNAASKTSRQPSWMDAISATPEGKSGK